MVKSIISHDFLSEWNHILCEDTADISSQDDIHIICHPKIGDQDGKVVKIVLPFDACCRIFVLHLCHKGFQ